MSDLPLLRERVGVRVNQLIGQLLRVSGGTQPSPPPGVISGMTEY